MGSGDARQRGRESGPRTRRAEPAASGGGHRTARDTSQLPKSKTVNTCGAYVNATSDSRQARVTGHVHRHRQALQADRRGYVLRRYEARGSRDMRGARHATARHATPPRHSVAPAARASPTTVLVGGSAACCHWHRCHSAPPLEPHRGSALARARSALSALPLAADCCLHRVGVAPWHHTNSASRVGERSTRGTAVIAAGQLDR